MLKTFETFKFYKKGLNITYSAVVLDDKSRNLLLSTFVYPNHEFADWKKLADHMTICLRDLPDHLKMYWLNEDVTLIVTELGVSDKAVAVRVTGFFNVTKSGISDEFVKFPHITLAINPFDAKPLDSNFITDWIEVEHLKIRGVVKEIEF